MDPKAKQEKAKPDSIKALSASPHPTNRDPVAAVFDSVYTLLGDMAALLGHPRQLQLVP
jgi:hypothetical protein